MGVLRFLLLVCFLPPLVLSVRRLYRLRRNHVEARQLGIPIKVLPWNRQDDIWLIIWRYFYPFVKPLPFNLGSWMDYSFHGWNVHSRFRGPRELGDLFVLVTPNENEIVFLDPQAGIEVEANYRVWVKPDHHYGIFNLFGPNLLTINGEDWQRHRKITSPAFRELTYKIVWNESLRQAEEMVHTARSRPQGCNYLEDVKKDSVVFAMHVLSAAGFGHQHDFAGGVRKVKPGHSKSFSDTLWFIFTEFLTVVMFINIPLPVFMTPKWLSDIKIHVNEFRRFMQEAIEQQRRVGASPAGSGADVVSALVRANEVAKHEDRKAHTPSSKRSYLNDNELYGNMFIINLVGFEPAAAALVHVIPFLTADRDVQDWAGQEVDAVLGSKEDLDYEEIFPQLLRCNAILHETLRFWGPLGDTTRISLNGPQTLHVDGHDLVIPPRVYVNWDFAGAQTDERWWGPDALQWRPQRWIKVDATTGKESLQAPSPVAELAYNAWSGGPRVCPGKKFSQVEIVAFLAVLLRKYRLKPMVLVEKGMKTESDGARALLDVTNDGQMPYRTKPERMHDAGVIFMDR